MSVLYRALWSDQTQAEPDVFIDLARAKFTCWALDDLEARPLPDGTAEVVLPPDRARVIEIRTVDGEDTLAGWGLECVTRDTTAGGDNNATVWTTVMRVVANEEGVSVWIENQVESDDVAQRVKVGRPRLVDDLLSLPGKPHLAGSGLFIDVQSITADQVPVLIEHLQSASRSLPVIVCSEPGGEHDGRWQIWAERIARRGGGIASVFTLDADAVTAFRRDIGPLAVWGGGVRTYMPGPVSDPSDGWRHRYVLGHLMASREDSMIDRIVYGVAQASTRRRVPDTFLRFTAIPPAAEADTESREAREKELARERSSWETALEDEIAQTNAAERELNQKIGHLDRIRSALEGQALHDLFWGTLHETGDEIPDEVQDTSEAVMAAQMYLTDRVVVHDDAARDLDGIDTCPQAYAWGNKAWRGFRAFAAYAESRASGFRGGFWEWCREGGPFAWPANSKHLSMTESESVRNNEKLSRFRVLPVSSEVSLGGTLTMLSHLKIAEGGGDLAPRIYFYDDTGGHTGRVHVGFVGPHYLMPNTKS
ncbi:hypothetical protein [Ornithinimicrobium avium]|uniref:Rhodanese domain-containing protein n=1 Tax=Ornithinimicrobium avium TaxID=2283195 RepID=A0A345NLU7_9MICO|nr:hypothetical protein [Ornithinimicrobium avium]AXH96005.1 hypothetical protein DV701_07575 [Ornithinimicrobium avium]